jgi:hypothetical protein
MKRPVTLVAAFLGCAVGAAAKTPVIPTPIGVGPIFHPVASNAPVELGLPVGSLLCTRSARTRVGVHLELFARGRVVIVPAGIGVALPLRREGAYVLSGRCSYPVRTREPTGVIELARSAHVTLGEFFAVWGSPLTRRRLVGFRAVSKAGVRAYVNGRLWRGDPYGIPLRRHTEIVLEIGGYVPPHASYLFRKGL